MNLPQRNNLPDPSIEALVSSAGRLLRLAVTAWVDRDFDTTAVLAPISVELLGKAFLWNKNPALLVPLNSNYEESLHLLATGSSLSHPQLRTIGLTHVLSRLQRYIDPFPLPKPAVRSLVDARNGAVHVGTTALSENLLVNALTLCRALAGPLGLELTRLVGNQGAVVQEMLEDRRSQLEAEVQVKLARARARLVSLADDFSDEVFQSVTKDLQDEAQWVVDPGDFGAGSNLAINQPCPECGMLGRLVGRLAVDAEPDWDVGDDGEPWIVGVALTLDFHPVAFACNVCRLALSTTQELTIAGVPSERRMLDTAELDEDFDIADWSREAE